MTHLDVWKSGTESRFTAVQKNVPPLHTARYVIAMTYLDVWKSGTESRFTAVQKNVPPLHTSRYVIARDSVLPGLPPR